MNVKLINCLKNVIAIPRDLYKLLYFSEYTVGYNKQGVLRMSYWYQGDGGPKQVWNHCIYTNLITCYPHASSHHHPTQLKSTLKNSNTRSIFLTDQQNIHINLNCIWILLSIP